MTDPRSAPELPDQARILSFPVGHGDCTLLELSHAGQIAFRMLVDGGQVLPDALGEHLRKHPHRDAQVDLDLLVLSHVDADHQGGLPKLLEQGVRIREYLGPCLPAFRRLSWLFAPRVQEAVRRAEELELALRRANVPVTYPFEGYVDRLVGGRVTLSVLSPAARLLTKLALGSGGELANLLMRSPLPLQWLIEADSPPPEEDEWRELRARFGSSESLRPEDFPDALPAPNFDPKSIQEAAKAHQQRRFEPDFFGNAVLNDTSLVLAVDFLLDGVHRRRIVLTGDQENWSYLAAMHPAGLGIDVLKAPHHGGLVYLEEHHDALARVYTWLRPRSVFVSANGRHHLPRADFRNALRAIGAGLLCPNARSIEPLTAGAQVVPGSKSCFEAFACAAPRAGAAPTIITLSAASEHASAHACVQGLGPHGVAPIVVLQQNVVSPSEAFVRWTRGELTKHANWIKRQLDDIHARFVEKSSSESSIAIAVEQLPSTWSVLGARARHENRHDLAADPQPALRFGATQRLFWMASEHHRSEGRLYRLPRRAEINELHQWLRSVPNILGRVTLDVRQYATADRVAILHATRWPVLSALVAARLAVPRELVDSDLLPSLHVLLSEHFEAHVCTPGSPYHAPGEGGTYLMRLTNKAHRVDLPNLLDEEWEGAAIHHYYSDERREQIWQALAQAATRDVLLADRLEEGRYSAWSVPNHWLQRFDLDSSAKAVDFAGFLEHTRWTTLWK